jgi:hypothetical protein
MSTASIIPYHLRPHKAIERQLFIDILRKVDRCTQIDIQNYKYIGFGAPFLEDFKALHLDFGITDMDCIEYDPSAYSRQIFNNPFNFIKFFNEPSTFYITGTDFPADVSKIIWFDYASPGQLRQQLMDIELLGEKLSRFDIVKFTFNSSFKSFITSNHVGGKADNYNRAYNYLRNDPTYQLFLADSIKANDLQQFSEVIRSMAIRAIKRGLSKSAEELNFNHIASFFYADGQQMTTITGIIDSTENFQNLLQQSGLAEWKFYQPESELITGNEISVPVMTVSERIKIDQLIPTENSQQLAETLTFRYGQSIEEHTALVKGYCEYYKYLPYYSKVTY